MTDETARLMELGLTRETAEEVARDNAVFAAEIEAAKEGLAALARNEGDLPELLGNAKESSLSPAVIGQLLMETLPYPGEAFKLAMKQYWMEVGEYLGPDWMESLRKTTAFMIKAGEF